MTIVNNRGLFFKNADISTTKVKRRRSNPSTIHCRTHFNHISNQKVIKLKMKSIKEYGILDLISKQILANFCVSYISLLLEWWLIFRSLSTYLLNEQQHHFSSFKYFAFYSGVWMNTGKSDSPCERGYILSWWWFYMHHSDQILIWGEFLS